MNGIQNLIQHFLANAIGHKGSSIIGGIAAVILAAIDTATQQGLIDIPALKPEWAHYVALLIAGLTFAVGLAANPNAEKQ